MSPTPLDPTPLSPTPRTTLGRSQHRGVEERQRLLDLLADAVVAHVGVVVEGEPLVLPVAIGVDPDGPDPEGSLYVHGSVGARWLRTAMERTVCVSVTEVDGLVLARSAFNHSMNYRSAVILGTARRVTDPDELARAFDLVVDQLVPGRAATLRPHTRKEVAATAVFAIPLREASMKARSGGPGDEPEDIESGAWGGELPLRRVAGEVVSCPATPAPVPDEVTARAVAWAAR